MCSDSAHRRSLVGCRQLPEAEEAQALRPLRIAVCAQLLKFLGLIYNGLAGGKSYTPSLTENSVRAKESIVASYPCGEVTIWWDQSMDNPHGEFAPMFE
jgi:hypothetical protein